MISKHVTKSPDLDHLICMNPDCETAYYDSEAKCIISTPEIKKPIWFKAEAEPKIACYCNNISYKQVEEAVRIDGLTSWKEIVHRYREKAVCACHKMNPTGNCCSENFYRIVNSTLEAMNLDILPENECTCG